MVNQDMSSFMLELYFLLNESGKMQARDNIFYHNWELELYVETLQLNLDSQHSREYFGR